MSGEFTENIATAATKASTATSYVAAGFNVWLGLSVNEWSMLIGATCALGTFWVNWYYRRREDMRAEERVRRGRAAV